MAKEHEHSKDCNCSKEWQQTATVATVAEKTTSLENQGLPTTSPESLISSYATTVGSGIKDDQLEATAPSEEATQQEKETTQSVKLSSDPESPSSATVAEQNTTVQNDLTTKSSTSGTLPDTSKASEDFVESTTRAETSPKFRTLTVSPEKSTESRTEEIPNPSAKIGETDATAPKNIEISETTTPSAPSSEAPIPSSTSSFVSAIPATAAIELISKSQEAQPRSNISTEKSADTPTSPFSETQPTAEVSKIDHLKTEAPVVSDSSTTEASQTKSPENEETQSTKPKLETQSSTAPKAETVATSPSPKPLESSTTSGSEKPEKTKSEEPEKLEKLSATPKSTLTTSGTTKVTDTPLKTTSQVDGLNTNSSELLPAKSTTLLNVTTIFIKSTELPKKITIEKALELTTSNSDGAVSKAEPKEERKPSSSEIRPESTRNLASTVTPLSSASSLSTALPSSSVSTSTFSSSSASSSSPTSVTSDFKQSSLAVVTASSKNASESLSESVNDEEEPEFTSAVKRETKEGENSEVVAERVASSSVSETTTTQINSSEPKDQLQTIKSTKFGPQTEKSVGENSGATTSILFPKLSSTSAAVTPSAVGGSIEVGKVSLNGNHIIDSSTEPTVLANADPLAIPVVETNRDEEKNENFQNEKSSIVLIQLNKEQGTAFCEKSLSCEARLRQRETLCQRKYAFPNSNVDEDAELSDLIVQAELVANSALAGATEAVSKACLRPITSVVQQQLSGFLDEIDSSRISCTRRTAPIRNLIAYNDKTMCEAMMPHSLLDEKDDVDKELCSQLEDQSGTSEKYTQLMNSVKRIQSDCERKIMATLQSLHAGFVSLTS
ncbi:unnamed protein product [Gongylonema pulchrum]|uniref:Uncharacterized protein n=1 Tax=Gongylonema pulchrum TaxID=637853 RepID=A0A3P7N617_9BILA|nr:unnamed protein product [Gongylonema pulchrum]